MNTPRQNRLVLWIAILVGVLWTLTMGVGYALVGFSDELTSWLNRVFGVPPEAAQWLAATGVWLEQWGGWVLVILWALGFVALILLSWFASKIARHVRGLVTEDSGESPLPLPGVAPRRIARQMNSRD